MKIVALLIIFLVMGVLFKSHPAVLSTDTSNGPTETPKPTETTTPKPTQKIIIFNTPTTTPKPVVESNGDWQYPGSTKVGDNKWQSSDSATIITDWYVAKIKALGAPVTSFVKTQANEKILNSLAAAKSNWKIKVEVSQESAKAPIFISVVLDNPFGL